MMPGQMPVKYERVDRKAVHEIFTSHILGGQPLLERVLDGPAEQSAEHETWSRQRPLRLERREEFRRGLAESSRPPGSARKRPAL